MADLGKLIEKFYRKIVKDHQTGCWIWQGYTNRDGYGMMQVGKSKVSVHRWSYEFIGDKGSLNDMIGRHKCDNPLCCNPDHIEPGTYQQNSQDIIDRGRHANANKTHCPYGHEYAGDNLRINATTGYRECKACTRAKNKSVKLVPVQIKFKKDNIIF